ncbi:MAG TPA: glycolate oxidase subunit GlcE [Gammaproteobacteria bacterium]|nr:glycolate oxidase subunit GlcE [Gammaproteobacteria bacterium]
MTEIAGLAEQVRAAAAARRALRIRGGGSKDFYGNASEGDLLDVGAYRGVVAYEPSELFITARAGTSLAEVEKLLAGSGQMLAFEPPHSGPAATIGGMVAAGLSGPRRLASGALRDFVLGVCMLDGRGRMLRFGGQVIKNVAGYDISRLMAGALGTLGIILEVSLKVVPRPRASATLKFSYDEKEATQRVNGWVAQGMPVSASAFSSGDLSVRLEGGEQAVAAACQKLRGERIESGRASQFWVGVREQADPFFNGAEPLWRLSVPPLTLPLSLPGRQLVEWAGGLRWLKSNASTDDIRAAVSRCGGHATLFRGGARSDVFHPLPAALREQHVKLKRVFDLQGIFNPGRLYSYL